MATAKKKPAPKKVHPGQRKESVEDRHSRFIEEFLTNGGNATQAAIAVGYAAGPSARVQGCRLLATPNISMRIEARRLELRHKLEFTTEDVLRSMAQAVKFDPRRLFHPDGRAKMPHELDDDTAGGLQGVELEVLGGKVTGAKYKTTNKDVAREQAMKHFGLFKADNVQRSPLEGLPRDVLKAIAAKLGGMSGNA